MADFKGRVEGYADLHKQLAKGDAEQKKNSDPAQITKAKTALAAKIQGGACQCETGRHLHSGDAARLPPSPRARTEG